jgi:hypothetical protein
MFLRNVDRLSTDYTALYPRRFTDGDKTCALKELKNRKRTYFSKYDEVPDSHALRWIIYVHNIHELTSALVTAEWSASRYGHFPPREDLPSTIGGTYSRKS